MKKSAGTYIADMMEIDINLIERSIRPIALGRKNYMFAGSSNAELIV